MNSLMAKALFLSPMVPSTNVVKTAEFLQDALGFSVRILDSEYAICTRDGLSLHLLPAGKDLGQLEFYLEVDDLDSMWQQMEPFVNELKHKPPFDQPYLMREVHVELPFTKALMFIGMEIKPSE